MTVLLLLMFYIHIFALDLNKMLRLFSVLFFLTMLMSSEVTTLVNNFDEPSHCILDINQEGDLEQESKKNEKNKNLIVELRLITDSSNEDKPLKTFYYLNKNNLPVHQEQNDPPPEL